MYLLSLFWIIFSYFVGSIPFGYLISRLFGKNILEIGWKKTSGSNVFKNVGKWQGVVTGILDLLKGYLVVFAAQRLGFTLDIVILSGLAVILGHNWSIFLKFSGGRGIGTFIGAALALFPEILGLSLIIFLIFSLIWHTAIATILFLITIIILSIYFNQICVGGLFTILALIPLFIKRLSPIKDLFFSNKDLFRNRLIFDDDKANFNLRAKRIIERLTKK